MMLTKMNSQGQKPMIIIRHKMTFPSTFCCPCANMSQAHSRKKPIVVYCDVIGRVCGSAFDEKFKLKEPTQVKIARTKQNQQ